MQPDFRELCRRAFDLEDPAAFRELCHRAVDLEDPDAFRELCRRAVDPNAKLSTEAFGVTYGAQHESLFRHAWRLTGDSHAAEDILSETIKTVLTKKPDPFTTVGDLRALMFGIARNFCKQEWQRRARHPTEPLHAVVARVAIEQPDPHACLEANENEASVQAALSLLDPDDQEILSLRAEEFRYSEIGEILELTVAAVNMRLHHARNRFRAALQAVDPILAAKYPH